MLTCAMADGLMIITAAGKLSRDDLASFSAEFERATREQKNLPLLIDARTLKGYELGALWDDIKFDLAHRDDFGAMAVVGDERWKEWGTKFSKPFFKAKLRHFTSNQITEAEAWLRTQRPMRA